MSGIRQPLGLPSWADQMQALERVGDNLIADLAPRWRDRGRGPGHEQARAVDPRRAATCAGSTPTSRRPVFMPLWNYAFNQGGPDPDYVYSTAEIDSARRLPDLGLPRDVALRRDHAAGAST